MSRSAVQFQKGLSLREFQRLYGTEEQCEAALEQARWPEGFRCPRCECKEFGLIHGRRHNRYQCRICGHQATLTAVGTELGDYCRERDLFTEQVEHWQKAAPTSAKGRA